jgi:ADP-dependent NAD(P)H-hydrate dehydratase / NAD(P)H-hydrate epimerase
MSKVVEVMTLGLDSTPEGTFSFSALPSILKFVEDKDLIAIGPGITTHPDCIKLVHELIRKFNKIMVIDADGLNAIAADISVLEQKAGTLILTPHPGEMARLVNMPAKEIQKNRPEIAQEFAEKFNVILVLKGYRTIIALPDGIIWVNPTGNAGMATAGAGDVLTGMIAGFVAQSLSEIDIDTIATDYVNENSPGLIPGIPQQSPLQQIPSTIIASTLAAVYLHGLAGDLAQEKYGELSLLAGNIMKFIPNAIKHAKGIYEQRDDY